jgi:hypothetical protein
MVILRNIVVFALALVTLAAVSEVNAQESGAEVKAKDRGAMINADYSIAAPLGETRTFTARGSAQGLGFEARFYKKYFIAGLGVSWQVFRDEKQAPGTPSGAEYEARKRSLVPVMGTAYFRLNRSRLRTFVGAGIGAMLDRKTLQAQAVETTDDTWYVAVSATAGALFEVTPGFGAETKLRYVAGFKKDHKSLMMMQLTLGLTFFF